MVRGVLEIIKELSDKDHMTMIIVTHEMNFARDVSSKVIFMENGTVVESGPSREVFTNPKEERTREFLRLIAQQERKESK